MRCLLPAACCLLPAACCLTAVNVSKNALFVWLNNSLPHTRLPPPTVAQIIQEYLAAADADAAGVVDRETYHDFNFQDRLSVLSGHVRSPTRRQEILGF